MRLHLSNFDPNRTKYEEYVNIVKKSVKMINIGQSIKGIEREMLDAD